MRPKLAGNKRSGEVPVRRESVAEARTPTNHPVSLRNAFVSDVGLKQSSDSDIWNYAKQNDCILFTTDNGFRQRALELGPPPQVILMERCDFPLRAIEEVIRRQTLRITDFAESNKALLILRR
jgi:predicted nuclease of predicted toxin-antitoxin system